MITLSYGYKKPQNPDTGDIFFPALEDNWQRVNDHNHDGSNSAPLAITNQQILPGAWVAAPIGGGMYRQVVTLPGTRQYDTTEYQFRLSNGARVYPNVEKVSANSYYIYTNDNTQTYVAFYR